MISPLDLFLLRNTYLFILLLTITEYINFAIK